MSIQADTFCIYPPEPSLFDQLCAWLDQCPRPTTGFNHWGLSIGATALCLRWGTYLAVLMDKAKPIDPRASHPATSMISDEEMRRINIEASSNLACLLRLRHQDENAFFDRLRHAYEWLPMPQRRVKRKWAPLQLILETLVGIHQAQDITLPESVQTAVSHPYRTLANTIIHFVYRNGPIEDSHAGREPAYPLDRRRLTDGQARQLVRYTAERLSPFVSATPLWDGDLGDMPPWPARIAGLPAWRQYPHGWSLTESSSQIQLKRAWTE
ncbi:MAG: hypothetical protein L0332_17065 [Chloroflexi bacterium]|nr:hypothetical protein [Chloroflexota bacterium]MCI0728411.1 hypothetical protein [Chloroflexota bacterium]